MGPIPGARSEREAVRQYVDVLQQAISAFAENVFSVRGGFIAAAAAHTLALAGNPTMSLRDTAGERRLALRPELYFRTSPVVRHRGFHGHLPDRQTHHDHVAGLLVIAVPRRWTVQTVAYGYRLDDIGTGRQLVSYHWHPHVEGIVYPHMHMLAAPAEVRRFHVAVPHCTIKHVLTLAMRDFGIKPVRGDWQEALDHADAVLRASIGE